MSASQVRSLSSQDFESEVLRSDAPVLVDFWAPWCGPCRALAPTLDAVAQDVAGRAKVVKVNVDENPELAASFGVQSIPNLVFLRGGEVVDRKVGATDRRTLTDKLLALADEAPTS